MKCRWYDIVLFCLVASWCVVQAALGEPLYVTDQDKEIYEHYVHSMESETGKPLDELMIRTALYFLRTPYVAATLEKEPEGLVVNLREMDCTTFAENVLALARTVRSGDTTFENFCRNLQEIRYREGTISDYTDRLHYMTDWIYVNEQKGVVRDMGKEIGGTVYPLQLFFISTHPDSYTALKSHPDLVRKMADKEKEINARTCYYIPEEQIPELEHSLKNGDMICFTTRIGGLDVTHVGIVYKEGGKTTFMHASSTAKEVIVNPEPVYEYVKGLQNTTGILVARPV
ncbi:MAG: DUF1460 domain-containing protein [Tannerellaceae bacterium]|nr:DUF1460 domain-containing protein [Tannerellaceae bacterium]